MYGAFAGFLRLACNFVQVHLATSHYIECSAMLAAINSDTLQGERRATHRLCHAQALAAHGTGGATGTAALPAGAPASLDGCAWSPGQAGGGIG